MTTSTYHGNNGVAKVGETPTAIAEVTKFDVTETAPVADDTAMGDAWATHLTGGANNWSGSLDANYYPGDTTGQAVLTVGSSVSLELDPIGGASGNEKLSGTATITSRAVTVDKGAVVSVTIQFTGNGELTHGSIT
jgi:hypothetical protein